MKIQYITFLLQIILYLSVRNDYFDMEKVNIGRRIAFYVDIEFVKFPEQAVWSFGMLSSSSRKSISAEQGTRRKYIYKTEYNSNNIGQPTMFLLVAAVANLNNDWEYNLYQAAAIDCGTDNSNPLYDLSEDEILGMLGNNPKINGTEIKILKSSKTEGITRNSNGFKFEDEEGNVVATLDKEMLRVNGVRHLQGGELFLKAKLAGKEFFVVGDSLSAGDATSNWIGKFAELTGGIFNSDYNKNNISIGGTKTGGAALSCGQNRIKKLLSEKNPEIIIYENINDITTSVEDTDYSYMIGNRTFTDTVYDNITEAGNAFETELTKIPTLNKSIGHCLMIGYQDNQGYKLSISGQATTKRTATVRVGSITASIDINIGDSAATIIGKIYEVYWDNYEKYTDNSTYVAFTNNDGGKADCGHNGLNGGGLTVTTTNDYESVSYKNYYYIGKDTTDNNFNNPLNWVLSVPVSALYKGLFEYIYSKLPDCRVIMFIPTRMPIQWTENENGWDENLWLEKGVRIDMNYYKNTYPNKVTYDIFRKFQREIAQLYGVEVYDINDDCGINPVNHQTFYPSYNVHPLQAGNDRWGEILAKMLK